MARVLKLPRDSRRELPYNLSARLPRVKGQGALSPPPGAHPPKAHLSSPIRTGTTCPAFPRGRWNTWRGGGKSRGRNRAYSNPLLLRRRPGRFSRADCPVTPFSPYRRCRTESTASPTRCRSTRGCRDTRGGRRTRSWRSPPSARLPGCRYHTWRDLLTTLFHSDVGISREITLALATLCFPLVEISRGKNALTTSLHTVVEISRISPCVGLNSILSMGTCFYPKTALPEGHIVSPPTQYGP